MKKFFSFAMAIMALVLTSFVFTSCSSDNEDLPEATSLADVFKNGNITDVYFDLDSRHYSMTLVNVNGIFELAQATENGMDVTHTLAKKAVAFGLDGVFNIGLTDEADNLVAGFLINTRNNDFLRVVENGEIALKSFRINNKEFLSQMKDVTPVHKTTIQDVFTQGSTITMHFSPNVKLKLTEMIITFECKGNGVYELKKVIDEDGDVTERYKEDISMEGTSANSFLFHLFGNNFDFNTSSMKCVTDMYRLKLDSFIINTTEFIDDWTIEVLAD